MKILLASCCLKIRWHFDEARCFQNGESDWGIFGCNKCQFSVFFVIKYIEKNLLRLNLNSSIWLTKFYLFHRSSWKMYSLSLFV